MLSSSRLGVVTHRICLADPPTRLNQDNRRLAGLSLLRHPIASWTQSNRYGNINPFSIAYAVRPRLRTRLTLSGLTLLRKPWVFGVRVSRPHSRYSFRHNHFCAVQHTLPVHLHPAQNAPLPDTLSCESEASVADFSPAHYRRRIP